MTTIAFRDGILAADRLVSIGGNDVGCTRKLYTGDDFIAGFAGSRDNIDLALEWLKDGCVASSKPKLVDGKDNVVTAIVVCTNDGEIEYWWSTDNSIIVCDRITPRFFAIGSGKELALGAMAHGASVIDAVRCAAQIDIATGGGIEYVDLTSRKIGAVA